MLCLYVTIIMLLCKTGHGLPREAKKISTETWTDVAIEMWKGMNCHHLSRSAHRTPNFTNPEYFVCLLFEYFFQIKVLN